MPLGCTAPLCVLLLVLVGRRPPREALEGKDSSDSESDAVNCEPLRMFGDNLKLSCQ